MRVPLTDDVRGAIKAWMADKRLAQREVAKMTGITVGAVSNILTGKSQSIRDVNLHAFEPYINKYRNHKVMTRTISNELTESNYDADLWKWDVEILEGIVRFMKLHELKYRDLSKRFGLSIATLAELLEGDWEDGVFTIKAEDAPAFTAMTMQIASEFFKGE